MFGWFAERSRGSKIDTVVYVLEANCQGRSLECADETRGLLHGAVEVALDAGQTVVAVVEGYGDAAGPVSLTVSPLEKVTSCCVPNDGPGCDNRFAQQTVCEGSGLGELLEGETLIISISRFFGTSQNYVLNIEAIDVERYDCCDFGDWSGCNDPVVEQCVCEDGPNAVPSCCEEIWADYCVFGAIVNCGACQ